ncbi:hypothetical protein FIU94_06400 [Sulfitobacter sp. THAF37]|uniref:hypothetical protein n=1 Tax=Sulfitobacter sp. THAF37 TaxID=2587855 RepID=UPI001267A090|nr:hypothetical protein [Sulfitobacter sp. THAF37]QFT58454.1 hypothetical protein FIU94_06400 [Sulfitobacter sp. THAF37]
MAHHSNSVPTTAKNDKTLSQAIFIIVGVMIIAGGLWFLYQDTAPYHPDVSGAEGELYLSDDS